MAESATQLTYDLVPSPQLQAKLQRQMADLERNLKFKAPFGQATREVRDFGSELDRANQRVITLGASFAVLATSLRVLKDIVRSTIEVEKAFTEINAVFQLSGKGLDQFSKQLFSAARDTGQSFEKAASAAKEFSRQGLTAQETIKRTTDALILSRLANLDVAKSVDTLTASINGFQKSALSSSDIVNKLATVDARFAVSSADLAEALSRSGAAASDAGVSFDQLIGLVTAAQQTTARGGTVIGNALKTIFTRIERQDTIDAFRSLGVAVEDAQGQMLGALPLLQNFATTYDSLSGAIRKQAAEMVGGVYQINILKAVLGDLAKANGIATQATDVSKNATNEAIKRNEAMNQSLDSMLAKLGVAGKQIGSNLGSQSFAGPLKGLIGIALNNPITAALEDASGKAETAGGKIAEFVMKGFGGALIYGLGPLILKALGTVALSTGKNVMRDFSLLTNISTQAQKEAAIQQEIVKLYQMGGAALQQQLATMGSITQQAAALERILLGSGRNNTGQLASVIAQRGVYLGGGKRTPGAAGGYIPMAEESAAIAAGVGGAPASARAVFIPNFARGDGGRGIVANTSEFMAGGAIYNREMIRQRGLPPGATPVAAGGYIPHAAGGGTPDYSDPNYYKWRPIPLAGAFGVNPDDPRMRATSSGGSFFGGGASGQGFGQYAQALQANTAAVIQLTAAERVKIVTGGGPGSPANAAVHQQNPGYGRDYDHYMSRIDVASRVRQFATRRGGPSMAQIESVLNANEALEPFGKLPPNMVANLRTGPRLPFWAGMRQRIGGAFNRQNAGYAAMFGLPLVGANIDEGAGGTASGIGRGAASSGLSAAGFGASIGSFFGPMGTAIGGGVGLGVGGAYGALKKMEVSFEELAKRIGDANAKIDEEVSNIRDAFTLQENVNNLIRDGAPEEKINVVRRRRTDAILKINDPSLRSQTLAGINDPMALGKITENAVAPRMAREASDALQGAVARALGTSSTRGTFGYGDKATGEIADAVRPILSRMSLEDRKRIGRMTGENPISALQNIGQAAGLSGMQQEELTGRATSMLNIRELGTQKTIDLFQGGIQKALHDIANNGIIAVTEASKEADRAAVGYRKSLEDLSSEYQIQSKLIQINAEGMQRISGVRQQIILGNPSLTDTQRLATSGIFERSNIASQFGAQRQSEVLNGRAQLIDFIRDSAPSADSKAVRDRIDSLSSTKDVQSLITMLKTNAGARQLAGLTSDNGKFMVTLGDFAKTMTALDETEKSQIAVSKLTNELLMEQLRESGTFSGAVSEDSGNLARARKAAQEALVRNDPIDVQMSADNRSKVAFVEVLRRFGMRNQGDVDVVGLQGSMEERLSRRQRDLAAQQRLGSGFRVGQGIDNADIDFEERKMAADDALRVAIRRGDEEGSIRSLRMNKSDLALEDRFRGGKMTEAEMRLQRLANRQTDEMGAAFSSGSDVHDTGMATARERGLQGDSRGSFSGAFRSVIEGSKRDLLDLSAIGQQVANSLHSGLTNAWTDFVTGAKNGKDAFRDFAASITGEMSRMAASKAAAAFLSFIPGFGTPAGATGGRFTGSGFMGFAAGGAVPAMLTGGEYYVSPRAAKRIGYDTLKRLNHYADGGVVRGGSGVRDDVPARLAPGSFIVKKSATQRLGPDYLNALVSGRVQHRGIGGILLGALLGGGAGYAVGGKRGALGGALLGGIGGYAYGANAASAGRTITSPGGNITTIAGSGASMSMGARLALGFGASAGLGLLAGGIGAGGGGGDSGPWGLADVEANRQRMEAEQTAMLAGRGAKHAVLQLNPQGGMSLAGLGDQVATRRWSSGGGVDVPMMPSTSTSSSAGGAAPTVSIKIDINNNGTTSGSSSSNGDGPFGKDFAGRLEQQVRGIVQDEMVKSYRDDGFMSQRRRLV